MKLDNSTNENLQKSMASQNECAVHEMHLNDRPFQSVKSGNKTIEMRLYDEKRRKIKKGDIIIFKNNDQRLQAKVINLHIFDSFDLLYSAFDKQKIGYDKNEPAKPSDMLEYYSKEDQQKYGVVGIEIELI